MEKIPTIVKNIKSLAASTALFFVVTTANAQVVYTNVSDGEREPVYGDYDIDLNKDGITEFIVKILKQEFQDPRYGYKTELDIEVFAFIDDEGQIVEGNAIASGNAPGEAISISANESIDNSSIWSDYTMHTLFHRTKYGKESPGFTSYSSGNFENSTGNYVGVKFVVGQNTYFGYIGVDTKTDEFSESFTVVNFAYESTAGKAIRAGEVVTGITDTYIETNTTIRNINNTIEIDFKSPFNGTIQVINMNGQVIKTTSVSGVSSSIPMEGTASGIYQVVVFGEEGFTTEKVFLLER